MKHTFFVVGLLIFSFSCFAADKVEISQQKAMHIAIDSFYSNGYKALNNYRIEISAKPGKDNCWKVIFSYKSNDVKISNMKFSGLAEIMMYINKHNGEVKIQDKPPI